MAKPRVGVRSNATSVLVPSDKLGADRFAVLEPYIDILVPFQFVMECHDKAFGIPNDAGGRQMLTPFHSYDAYLRRSSGPDQGLLKNQTML